MWGTKELFSFFKKKPILWLSAYNICCLYVNGQYRPFPSGHLIHPLLEAVYVYVLCCSSTTIVPLSSQPILNRQRGHCFSIQSFWGNIRWQSETNRHNFWVNKNNDCVFILLQNLRLIYHIKYIVSTPDDCILVALWSVGYNLYTGWPIKIGTIFKLIWEVGIEKLWN